MTDNLFETTQEQAPTIVTTEATIDPLLASIVNEEGKPKYTSVQDAFKALANAQMHIKTIETENAQLREATTKAKTLEDVLNAMKPSEDAAPIKTAPKEPEQVDIASVIAETIAKIENEKIATTNQKVVVDKMKEVFGEEVASKTFYDKATELGFSKEEINLLASKNPKAVFKLFGLEDKKVTKNLQGSIRTDAFIEKDQQTIRKGGMAHGSTKDLVSEWRRVAAQVNQKLGIEQ